MFVSRVPNKNNLPYKAQPVYLDCNATTPVEPEVAEAVYRYLVDEYGNAGSRTHEMGARAKQAVERARDQVAALVACRKDEVIFTSGATEANNLAILGLASHGLATGRKHVVSTPIEHKAVLEPLEELVRRGFEVSFVPCGPSGRVRAEDVATALRPETLLVSMMQANNETGVNQPIEDVAVVLKNHPAWFHVDAAQAFGKDLATLRNARVDLLSASAHKIYGPKGVGALIARRRGFDKPPLTPLLFGGGQERGLRPGTQPVALIGGFGVAAELCSRYAATRRKQCAALRKNALVALTPLNPAFNGDPQWALEHVLNVSFEGVDSEALMVTLKDLACVSNGSACTSSSYTPSHVLKAMGLDLPRISAAIRISWCHMTPTPPWQEIADRILSLR